LTVSTSSPTLAAIDDGDLVPRRRDGPDRRVSEGELTRVGRSRDQPARRRPAGDDPDDRPELFGPRHLRPAAIGAERPQPGPHQMVVAARAAMNLRGVEGEAGEAREILTGLPVKPKAA
jgi:hypothetical protein